MGYGTGQGLETWWAVLRYGRYGSPCFDRAATRGKTGGGARAMRDKGGGSARARVQQGWIGHYLHFSHSADNMGSKGSGLGSYMIAGEGCWGGKGQSFFGI